MKTPTRKPNSELRSKYRKVKLAGGATRDEHRLIMESHIGRKLGRFEVVHHINGDKKDNRVENLQVMSLAAHGRLHSDPEASRQRAIAAGWRPPIHRGGAKYNASMTDETAATVKLLLEEGVPVLTIAADMKLSRFVVYKIAQGKTWLHVVAAKRAAA